MTWSQQALLASAAIALGCSSAKRDLAFAPVVMPAFLAAEVAAEAQNAETLPSTDVVDGETPAIQLVEYQTDLLRLRGAQTAGELPGDQVDGGDMPSAERSSTDAEELDLPQPLPAVDAISLDDVITTVYAAFPALDAATRERQIAAGKQIAAMGEFDLNLAGEAINEPLGFYENYRYGLGGKQYTWWGGQTFAGYRVGRGNFEPWYLERETNKGGEFKAGFALPFLRDRDIDKRRAGVFKARIDRTAAEPLLQLEIIDAVRAASFAYWDWVAAGQRVRIARHVLELATLRQEGLEIRSAKGDIAEIELVDNRRLIVSRQAKLTEAERKFNQSGIKLSLFLRNVDGRPLIATGDQLPKDFPQAVAVSSDDEAAQLSRALTVRPEFWLLDLERQRVSVEARQAANLLLPSLDGVLAASQDVGEPTSSKRDKSEFELEAGAVLDVPLQRRAAQGALQAARGKMAQIAAKRRLTEQKVVIDVQAARTGLAADYIELQQARQSAQLAERMEQAEREKFMRGDSNLLLVNLREQATADAQLLIVDAAFDYFATQAQLHAAIAAELGNDASGPTRRPMNTNSNELETLPSGL